MSTNSIEPDSQERLCEDNEQLAPRQNEHSGCLRLPEQEIYHRLWLVYEMALAAAKRDEQA